MNRKVLDYAILLKVLVRIVAIGLLFGFGLTQMPAVIFATSSVICALGFLTFYRSVSMHKSRKETEAFLCFEMAIIIFNMLFVSFSCPVAVTVADTLLTGSVFDLLVNICLFFYAHKQYKYAVVENEEELTTVKNIRRSKKAYVRPFHSLETR